MNLEQMSRSLKSLLFIEVPLISALSLPMSSRSTLGCQCEITTWSGHRAGSLNNFNRILSLLCPCTSRTTKVPWRPLGWPNGPIHCLARHPVLIMLLARLAVDQRWQDQGVGKALLKDAMLRMLQAADIAGIRAFAVHAKDEEARRSYLKFDFISSPSDPMLPFVLLKDVKRIVSAQ
jgi:hypothetical protein